MLNRIVIGRFINIDSIVHRQNALSKIISTIIFIVNIFINKNWYIFLLLFIFMFLIMILSNVKLKLYLKSLYSLKILIISVLFINLLCQISLNDTLVSMTRLILTVLYTTILTFTTPTNTLTYGLEQFFTPLRLVGIPVKKLAFAIAMAIRFIPLLLDEANTILFSLASKGVDYRNGNLKTKIKAIKMLMIPLISNSLRSADKLALSMELRLYSFKNKSTSVRNTSWRIYDAFMVILHCLILGIVIKGDVLIEIFNNFFL